MGFHRERNYGTMGLYLMDNGGHGGKFNAYREAWEGSLKHWLGLETDSFGSLLVLVWVVLIFRELCCAISISLPLCHKVGCIMVYIL